MKKTRVVNMYHEPYDVTICRGTPWGNPYRIGIDGTRKEVIEKYRRLKENDIEFLKSIEFLRGKTLGCFCKPKECHGDVIIDLLDE